MIIKKVRNIYVILVRNNLTIHTGASLDEALLKAFNSLTI